MSTGIARLTKPAWQAPEFHYEKICNPHLRTMFAADPKRCERLTPAGVAINPATPASVLEEILQDVEQVLIMTVNPGFRHQHFVPTTLAKIRRVRQMIEQVKQGCDVEVDGGLDAKTAPLAVAAGANVLVAGTAIFGESEGVAAAMERLRAAIR
jgi:ribulose-phosphate 3-epimerase